MLRVLNKTISFAKGESVAFSVEIKDGDGQPFIFPPILDLSPEDIAKCEKILVFTVINNYGTKVLERVMDIRGPIVYLTATNEYALDNSAEGYAKFTTQEIEKVNNINNFFGYTKGANGNSAIGTAEQKSNRLKIAKIANYNDWYYCWVSNTENADDDDGQIGIYKFMFALALAPSDTESLRYKEYKYDLVAYIKLNNEVLWRRQLIGPSPLILEDSNG